MKIKVGVLYGGKTTEHEVSIISALQAMENLDKEKYDVVPIYLTKNNEMYTGMPLVDISIYKDFGLLKRYCKKVTCYNKDGVLYLQKKNGLFKKIVSYVDIVLPIVHGYNMEDGNIQGLLSVNNIPYCGSDIYGCVVGQDKIFQKQILEKENIPVTKYTWFYDFDYIEDENKVIKDVEKIGYPVIIKPARQGSSIGIGIAKNKEELKKKIDDAILYDNKILVEEVIDSMTELNCSVLGTYKYQEASVIEEVSGDDDILSFNDKYIGNSSKKMSSKKSMSSKIISSSKRKIPAQIPDELKKNIEETSKKTFKVLGASGVVRIDYLYDNKNKKYYVNELNTIPGSLAFYLWKPLGKNYSLLLDEIINIGIKRYKENNKKTTTFESNILTNYNGSKGCKKLK